MEFVMLSIHLLYNILSEESRIDSNIVINVFNIRYGISILKKKMFYQNITCFKILFDFFCYKTGSKSVN